MQRFSLIGIVLAIFVTGIIGGCVKTQMTAFTDRDYEGYRIHRVAIRAIQDDYKKDRQIEGTIVRAFKNDGVPAESFISRFSPTRTWSESDVAKDLSGNDFDTIMYVSAFDSQVNSQIVGYTTSGQASTYGNTTAYHGSTTANRRFSRYTAIRVTLYDVKTAKVIWVADCNTIAGGALFMGDQTQLNSLASKMIKALKKDRHIATSKREHHSETEDD